MPVSFAWCEGRLLLGVAAGQGEQVVNIFSYGLWEGRSDIGLRMRASNQASWNTHVSVRLVKQTRAMSDDGIDDGNDNDKGIYCITF